MNYYYYFKNTLKQTLHTCVEELSRFIKPYYPDVLMVTLVELLTIAVRFASRTFPIPLYNLPHSSNQTIGAVKTSIWESGHGVYDRPLVKQYPIVIRRVNGSHSPSSREVIVLYQIENITVIYSPHLPIAKIELNYFSELYEGRETHRLIPLQIEPAKCKSS